MTAAPTGTVTIPARYAGPPAVANGGWLAGLLTPYVDDTGRSGEVVLRRPTPLDVPVTLAVSGGDARLTAGEQLLAFARPGTPDGEPPAPVDVATADRLAETYRGRTDHPYGGCFVCGAHRSPDDALRLEPGRLDDRTVATPWRPRPWTAGPDGRASAPHVWAALDCPAAWAIDDVGGSLVLGRITGRIDALPAVDAPHVVVGRVDATRERTWTCSTALYDDDGTLLAWATSRWFRVDPADLAAAVSAAGTRADG